MKVRLLQRVLTSNADAKNRVITGQVSRWFSSQQSQVDKHKGTQVFSSAWNSPNFDRKEFQRQFSVVRPPQHEAFDTR